MNERMWIIIVALVIDIKCANANSVQYGQVYHTVPMTWQAASDKCDTNRLEFEEDVLTNIDVLKEKEFWLGMAIYRVSTPWIEILGCFAVPDRLDIKKSPSIVLCQKQCESYQFFGYSESTSKCSCLRDKGRSYSIKNCIEQNNSKYFFVYKVFRSNVSGNDNDKCTTLYCSGGKSELTAVNCNETSFGTNSICNNGSAAGWGLSYSAAKQSCMGIYQLLLSPEIYCQLNGHQNQAVPMWSNVFRADTDAKLTQGEAGNKEPLYCLAGSFKGENGKKELVITRRFCNKQLDYFVCRTGTVHSVTSNESLVAVPIPEKISGTTHSSHVQDSKHGAATSTTQNQIIIATQEMKEDSSGSFNIDPVIGGIVAAVILITVLLVVISCKISSCGFFKTTSMDKQEVSFSTAVSEHSQNSEVRTSEITTSNESYGLSPNNSTNVYAVVNKIKKNEIQTTEDTYIETSFGEYDRLNGVSKRRTDAKENLYNSHAGIRNENDPTYDSSNHGGRTLQFDNDVYDHTDTLLTDGSDYGYSSTLKSEARNENDIYDKAV